MLCVKKKKTGVAPMFSVSNFWLIQFRLIQANTLFCLSAEMGNPTDLTSHVFLNDLMLTFWYWKESKCLAFFQQKMGHRPPHGYRQMNLVWKNSSPSSYGRPSSWRVPHPIGFWHFLCGTSAQPTGKQVALLWLGVLWFRHRVMNFRWSSVQPGAGLKHLCGLLLTRIF